MAGSSLLASFSQLLPAGLPLPAVAGAQRLLGLDRLAAVYDTLQQNPHDGSLPGRLLRHLRVDCRVSPGDLRRVPRTGPTLVVSNHPYGILESAVLAELLSELRPDVKFLANSLMLAIEEIRHLLLPVDILEGKGANLLSVKRSIQHLRDGGTLVLFPAGEVSHYRFREGVADPEWKCSVARIARLANATVVPVFVHGRNSALFQAAGIVHPRLRTALLVRELLNKHGAIVDVRIGAPVPVARLQEMTSDEERTKYLRWRTDLLGVRDTVNPAQSAVRAFTKFLKPPAVVAAAASVELKDFADRKRSEVLALPASRLLLESPEFAVYLAPANEIPGILREIGRLREVTFRQVGEGTGKSLDLDEFDAHYQHLFLWDKSAGEVAGAYRLAICSDILARRGAAGLYTATLFHYDREFLQRLERSAVELGRSFIRTEYQKSFAPLLMLWKGIGRFIARNPRCTMLFGPVSISNKYREISRQLMVNFLQRQAMAGSVPARNGYKPRLSRQAQEFARNGAGWIAGLDELSEAVQDIDSQAVPVLLRQYLSLGGKLLGFNVDPRFSNALDGLILVDLRETEPRLLERFMGKAEARQFLHNDLAK